MPSISVKSFFASKAPWVDLSQGILGSANPFYSAHRGHFPFKGVKALLRALEWPSSYEFLGTYPVQGDAGWTEELNGVTQDGKAWFFTSNRDENPELWRFPKSHDLDEDVDRGDPAGGIKWRHLPISLRANKHAGGIDHYQGSVYVPLQPEQPRTIAVFKADDLSFVTGIQLASGKGVGAWCAINPFNACLYESIFHELDDPPAPISLMVYKHGIQGSTPTLTFVGEYPLYTEDGSPFVSRGIQGGVFSANGHFYLIADSRDDHSGVHGFDMFSGRRKVFLHIHTERAVATGEELEDIVIWDHDAGDAPHMWGQIHVILVDNDYIGNDDDLDFKHFRVPEGDRDKL
jgi:hypothetical protein